MLNLIDLWFHAYRYRFLNIRGFGKNLFDFFGYDNASPYFNAENKKVISKMKDEMGFVLRRKSMELRAKMCLTLAAK